MKRNIVTVFLTIVLSGCLTFVTIDEKTALERQIIGTYQSLGTEVLMLAAMRAKDETAQRPEQTSEEVDQILLFRKALSARRLELFLRDDVDSYLADGCAEEAENGLLRPTACRAVRKSAYKAQRDRILAALNDARYAVVDYIIFANPDLTPQDRPQVVATVHHMKKKLQSNKKDNN